MAHFRGTLRGSRGEASRLGSRVSGLTVTANGGTSGVKVDASVDHEGNDRFQVILTDGSHGPDRGVIAEVVDGRLMLDPWGDFDAREAASAVSA